VFLEQITTDPAPCPGCGAELSAGPDDGEPVVSNEPPPPAPPQTATAAAGTPAEPSAPTLPDDVAPEPETSVRPPDLRPERDPLEGWDESGTLPAPPAQPDPVVLAASVGTGLLLGLLLGGRDHRGLGAFLGVLLGAVVARLRG
jgi:hypothetical protein